MAVVDAPLRAAAPWLYAIDARVLLLLLLGVTLVVMGIGLVAVAMTRFRKTSV